MSLEILYEAALYLEYQTEAQKRGEVPKDYKTFSALQNNVSPPASSSPPRPTLPPPPPPAPHNTPISVHSNKVNHVNGVGGSPVGKMSPGSPPFSASYHPDGPYLAARLTAPTSTASNGAVVAPDSSAFIKVKKVPLTLTSAPPLPSTPPIPVNQPSSYAPTSSSNSSSPSSATGGVGSSNGGNISPQELKRRVGAGTREVHNKLEKNRRAHLKECFELLRRQLPPCGHDDKKPSNLTVLHSAIRYIQTLKRKERDYEHEMERLAREKISFQQRLSSLKKEISSQYDSVDFAALLPDVPPPSALKAPQVHLGSGSLSKPPPFDSDDDFEFEEEDESLRHKPSPISPQHSASTSTASERGHLSDVEDLTTTSSRPGSSRDVNHSPPLLATTNPNSLRPSAVVEHPCRDLRTELSRPLVVTTTDSLRKSSPVNSILPEMMTVPTVGTKLHLAQQPSPLHLSQITNKHIGDHISRQSHVQLVSSPTGLINTSGPTTLVGPAIQLLAAPSGLRMLTTAPPPDQRPPALRDEVGKAKLSSFITTAESSNSSRLPGGAEINVISSVASSIGSSAIGLIRSSSKPINLSASASKMHLSTNSAPPILNGGVISHASSLHRPTLPPGQSGTTVLSTVPPGTTQAMGVPHTVTHHLTQATGITHVVTASGGAAHISTLAPLVAGPVHMVAPGNHPSGVHILATGKSPFQVVSPILKHQVLPAQAYLSGQLVKPVMMVSSAASVVTTAPRPHSGEMATNGSIPTKGVNPS